MTVKHPTASAYLFTRFPDGWRLGLVEHPRLERHTLPGAHIHVDHQYVAVADDTVPVRPADHPFAWYHAAELGGVHMFDGARLTATMLFERIDELSIPGLLHSS